MDKTKRFKNPIFSEARPVHAMERISGGMKIGIITAISKCFFIGMSVLETSQPIIAPQNAAITVERVAMDSVFKTAEWKLWEAKRAL